MTILGISIGTTRTGVCVLRDGVLIDRQIHNYDAVWSDTKLHVIINRYKRYVRKRHVQAIIVKVSPLRKHTKAITQILARLETLAKKHKCSLELITKNDIKRAFGLHSTTALSEYARLLYPQLIFVYEKGATNDHSYYKKLFEAILAAHIYEERDNSRTAR